MPGPLASSWLRDAAWLTPARARAYVRILFGISLAAALIWIAMSPRGIDPLGKPLGADFISFWTASRLALSGHPAAVYDVGAHYGLERRLFGHDAGFTPFFYPPVFLLACLPLGALPYLAALAAWMGATGAAYYKVTRAWLGRRFGVLPILAFPGAFITVGHGQNGFLSMALLGAGASIMGTRPILAGVCFGCLVYKPQLALVLPIALLAASRWKTIVSAAATAGALVLASVLVFGAEAWRGFFAQSALARAALEQHLVGDAKMQSAFAAVRLLGGGLPAAYLAQVIVAVAACAGLVILQRRTMSASAAGAAMIAATLLASPYLLDYDLVLLAVPLAWVARQGARGGFLPWEKIVLFAGFVLPIVSRAIATDLRIPLAPLVLAAVFLVVLRRGFTVVQPSCDHTIATQTAGANPVRRSATGTPAPTG